MLKKRKTRIEELREEARSAEQANESDQTDVTTRIVVNGVSIRVAADETGHTTILDINTPHIETRGVTLYVNGEEVYNGR